MKRALFIISCLLCALSPLTASAAIVTKVTITTAEPKVGEKLSFKATVPPTASSEVYETHWAGEFDNGVFIQGNDYTITVKLRIKSSSANSFSTTGKINATVNGQKAQVVKAYASNQLWISGFLMDMCGAELMLTALSQAPVRCLLPLIPAHSVR